MSLQLSPSSKELLDKVSKFKREEDGECLSMCDRDTVILDNGDIKVCCFGCKRVLNYIKNKNR